MRKRVAPLLIVLTGHCDAARPHVLCGTGSRLRKAWFSLRSRCAAAAILTALAPVLALTGGGCAFRTEPLPPLVIKAAPCAGVPVPVLPPVDGETDFDTVDQYGVFMERDDVMRAYIRALRRADECWRAQAGNL